jgi:hypothetical protein
MEDSGELHTPDRFTPWLKVPGTDWVGGWVGPRTGLDAVAKRRKSVHCACRELNHSRLVRSLVCVLTQLPRLVYEI